MLYLLLAGRDGPASASSTGCCAALLCSGCASHSVLPPGRPRTPRRGVPTSEFRCVCSGVNRRSRLDLVDFYFVVQGLAADAEAFGGFELVAAGIFEHLENGISLHCFHQSKIGGFHGG